MNARVISKGNYVFTINQDKITFVSLYRHEGLYNVSVFFDAQHRIDLTDINNGPDIVDFLMDLKDGAVQQATR